LHIQEYCLVSCGHKDPRDTYMCQEYLSRPLLLRGFKVGF
jgi:hypothetical protein